MLVDIERFEAPTIHHQLFKKLSIENEWMLIVVCHPLPPTQRFLETQFWRHAITSEGVVTIAPSVLRALRVNSGKL